MFIFVIDALLLAFVLAIFFCLFVVFFLAGRSYSC